MSKMGGVAAKGNEMDQTFENGRFMLGDCLERMAEIPDASVDMILCDLPYGTTACKWDSVIPFEPLWAQYWRIAKPNAAVVLTASQPFTTALIASPIKRFKYCWVWEKSRGSNPANVKHQPFKKHEDICVFSVGKANYYPIMKKGKLAVKSGRGKSNRVDGIDGGAFNGMSGAKKINDEYYPGSVLKVPSPGQGKGIHPTQKPVALFEYLIRTYTDEGMTVLDNCAGSGTTAIAAERSNRRWICIERDPDYFAKACDRVAREYADAMMEARK